MLHGADGKKARQSTLADYPRIIGWWHPTKNGTNLPGDYLHRSHKRVWLQCPGCPTCGEVHQWEATGNSLLGRGAQGAIMVCPCCSSKGGSFCSCHAISANPRLAAEWHEDNPPPATVAQGSNKSCKWRCSEAACGHVWEAKPLNRSLVSGTSCPECDRKARRSTPVLRWGGLSWWLSGMRRRTPSCPQRSAAAATRKCGGGAKCATVPGRLQLKTEHLMVVAAKSVARIDGCLAPQKC